MKLLLLTNIASPYRVDFFYYLQTQYPEHEIHILYTSARQEGREWNTDESKILQSVFLPSKSLTLGKGTWKRTIYFPTGVKRTLSNLMPDVVVAMEYNPGALAALAWCKKTKTPFVHWTDGTLVNERHLNFVQRLSRKKIVRGASCFIASSTKAKEKLLAYGAEKPIFISSLTVDIDAYAARKTQTNNVLITVGGLIERKGVDLLLNAIAKLQTPCRLRVVGSGPDEQALRKQAQTLGLDVEWLGFQQREELAKLYAQSGVFVLATREDCFGLVLLESMCASLPVVSSIYADGAYDLVETGVNGYLADPFDAEAFARAIEWVLAENTDNRMGIASYERAQRFRFEEVAKPYLAAAAYAWEHR